MISSPHTSSYRGKKDEKEKKKISLVDKQLEE